MREGGRDGREWERERVGEREGGREGCGSRLREKERRGAAECETVGE